MKNMAESYEGELIYLMKQQASIISCLLVCPVFSQNDVWK